MIAEIDQASELTALREGLGLTKTEFADKLGLSRQYLSRIENEKLPLSPKVRRAIRELQGQWKPEKPVRRLPVVSWAQAGIGIDYEELPLSWQREIACDCPDERAFAIELHGDSMEPKCWNGDLAVVMPTTPPRNGRLVVARTENEGVIFKLFSAGDLSANPSWVFSSYNAAYPPLHVNRASVLWIHPVYQIIRNVWD